MQVIRAELHHRRFEITAEVLSGEYGTIAGGSEFFGLSGLYSDFLLTFL